MAIVTTSDTFKHLINPCVGYLIMLANLLSTITAFSLAGGHNDSAVFVPLVDVLDAVMWLLALALLADFAE